MAGIMSIEDFGNLVANPGRQMSSNYAIGNDGRIGLFCPESDRSWCSSSAWNDNQSITIEVSNCATTDDWPIGNAAYTSLIKLCVDICQRNNISKLYYSGLNGTLTRHCDLTQTACPGPWMKSHTQDLCDKVNAELAKKPNIFQLQAYTQTVGDTVDGNAYPIASEYAVAGTLVNVEPNYKEIKCYMSTLDRTSKNVDYEALKGIGLIGTLLETGYLYDSSHMEVEHFLNPKLAEQVEAAKKAEVQYGFYTVVRSRNVQEANLELKWYRIYLQKYTPTLGAWLKLELSSNKAMNDLIIGRYHTLLTASGYTGKMGLYATRQQLKLISWDRWQEDFSLWLIDHVDDLSEIEQILDPTFFDL